MTGWLLATVVAICAFWLPGTLLARRAGVRCPNVGGYFVSLLALYALLMALQLTGVRLERWVVVGGVVGLTALIAGLASRLPMREARTLDRDPTPIGAVDALAFAWCAIAATIFGARLIADPLTGMDTAIRWAWLPELMLEHRHLDFYPPRTGDHYHLYSWPDGIPPLVQFGYFALYCAADRASEALSVIPVLLQYAVGVRVCYALAHDAGGRRAGLLAAALLVSTPLYVGAVLIGQETGLTAAAFGGAVLYLRELTRTGDWRDAGFAGSACAVAALTREYGAALVLAGTLFLALRRTPRRALLAFLVPGALAFTWYARTWVLTGNPVFSNNIAGLFPGNAVFDRLSAVLVPNHSLSHPPVLRRALETLALGLFALPWIGVPAALVQARRTPILGGALLIICACWAYSVHRTFGGVEYSTRVLSPAALILSVYAGALLAPRSLRFPRAGAVGVALLVASLPLLVTAPHYTYTWSPRELLSADRSGRPWAYRGLATLDARLGRSRAGIIVDSAGVSRWLRDRPHRIIPVWSPDARFLFDRELSPAERAEALERLGVTHLMLGHHEMSEAVRTSLAIDPRNWPPVHTDQMVRLYRYRRRR